MSLLSTISGLGGFGPSAAQQSAYGAQQAVNQAQYNNAFANNYILASSGSCNTVFTVDYGLPVGGSFTAKPDTALDWLERRITEMRVKL